MPALVTLQRRLPVRTSTWRTAAALTCLAAVATACTRPTMTGQASGYQPRTRALTVTTVPLLVKEAVTIYPFLKSAFATGGVLDGKEVYAFSPNTLTVVEGDTIHFTFINPEDDLHSFVLPDFFVSLPGGKRVDTTYVARHAGIFPIRCSVPSHLPMMSGQLVVLSATAIATISGNNGSPTTALEKANGGH